MSTPYKGISNLYDSVLGVIDSDSKFYEFTENGKYIEGCICTAPVWYEKSKKWQLIEDQYQPLKEEESTWKAKEVAIGGQLEYSNRNIQKYFEVRSQEALLTTTGKTRSVLLMSKSTNEWLRKGKVDNIWLCIPIFSYQSIHNQTYVLEDQRLNNLNNFYMPVQYSGTDIGMNKECALRYPAVQFINEKYLDQVKCMSNAAKMKKPIKLSESALKIVSFHFLYNHMIMNKFISSELMEEHKNEYTVFKELVNEEIDNLENK